jgi:hypothetical protein
VNNRSIALMPHAFPSKKRSFGLPTGAFHSPTGKATGKRSGFLTADTSLDTEPRPPCYLQGIENSLRNQYSIGYTPPRAAADGKYHKIKLTTDERHLVVDTRDGYYAK